MTEKNEQIAPMIAINAQYIKDISFEAPHVPEIFTQIKSNPEINVNVDVNATKINNNLFEVNLNLKAEAKAKITINEKEEEKTAFLCEVSYGCLATINVAPESIEPILLIEVPRLLFPFARNIIGDLTRESGFPPLMINPIDFAGLYQQRLAQIQREKQKATLN